MNFNTDLVKDVEDYSIVILDNEGNVKSWSRGAQKIKGYEENEVVGSNFRIFYNENDQRLQIPELAIKEAVVKVRLKSANLTKDIKIIAVTAFSMRGDMERVMAAGCDGFITKPINTRTFVGEIQKYI